jgi:preprotein translocase subunit SecA
MFSLSTTNTHVRRPGLIHGKYPERIDSEPNWIDRWDSRIRGSFLGLPDFSCGSLGKIVKEIGRRGDALTPLNTADLDECRMRLRHQLHSQGLTTRLSTHAFALIRETARRTLKLRHYDSQLMAGWVMLQGQVAEMETGEGKTLAATLAAATIALAGIPVHIITVNEYLVERDARSMGPLYRALGLTVGVVTQDMATEEKRAAYACDILYCTNKQIVFDYLRDWLLIGKKYSPLRLELSSAYGTGKRSGQFLLRGLCFAIVDEADNVLIDEARTPLILTKNIDNTTEQDLYRQILPLAESFEKNEDFFIDTRHNRVQLSRTGQQKLAGLFLSENVCRQEKRLSTRLGEELICLALQALHLLHRDRDYLVEGDTVRIIDANTGRTMKDRSWERGLHQFVEAKEGCPFTHPREQLGRLTYQRFFGRYLSLAGMTGTAREVRQELWAVYGLKVRQIPLHRPSLRRELPARIFSGQEEKWTAVIRSVEKLQTCGRPVLIGTGSLADSEILSQKLIQAGIVHQVLNARQDRAEANIIARAGQRGQVTVATNMAGRGTDIPLACGITELGGLHVIATCRNPAKRIDRQLFGRCGRQGDPGSHQAILSLEDEVVSRNCHPTLLRFLIRSTVRDLLFIRKLNLYIIRRAQKGMEHRYFRARKALLKHDRQTARLLGFSGHME